jgi:hypothetical protein
MVNIYGRVWSGEADWASEGCQDGFVRVSMDCLGYSVVSHTVRTVLRGQAVTNAQR